MTGSARSPATSGSAATRARPTSAADPEAVAGYLFVLIPMVLFLVLNIGAMLYALYISVWKWNIRTGPSAFIGLARTTRTP